MSDQTEQDGLDLSGVKNNKQRAFLSAICTCGTIRGSSRATGVSRNTHQQWMRNDPAYVALFDEAHQIAGEAMEQEARRRAMDGLVRKKFHNGEPVMDPETGKQYEEREYSDTLLIFTLKALFPEKYRERTEHNIAVDTSENARNRLIEKAKQDPKYLEQLRSLRVEDGKSN